MEVERSESLNVALSAAARSTVFVHSYSDRVDLDFNDVNAKNGVSHSIEVKMPLALARELAKELTNDIAEYDKKLAEKAAEEAVAEAAEEQERAEKIAEELGVEELGA
tara:strand:- start:459 stop:782 length:324 start_codon:yes stop_codon:yes gene_type:complete